ncbi:MAG: lactonase family protein [Chloroflexi bacterium]|nr:lactonase family protein [Chloroflexota bacterium]
MAFHVYVALQDDDRIARFVMDPETGQLASQGTVKVDGGPAPLAINPSATTLYVGQRNGLRLSSFAINQSTGDLTLTGSAELKGEPCYLSTDHTGRHVLSAYYQAGHCAVHPIDEDGAVGGEATEWLETNSGAHCFQTDPTNRFAFLPHIDTGSGGLALLPPGRQEAINAIYQFKFDAETGRLTPNDPLVINAEAEDGPRHYRFHPTKNLMYVSNEQGGSVTVYSVDRSDGTLTAGQKVTTLPDDYKGRKLCSQIQIHPLGTHLYVGNRGHNSIASFSIDETTGALTPTGWTDVDPIPRAFSLDPTGHFLYVAGLETGNLIGFRVDQETGELTRLETYAVGASPMWVMITNLAG